MEKCYVVIYSDELDDFGVFHIESVCATRESAEERIDWLSKSYYENPRYSECQECAKNDYTINGKTPDCFLSIFGECGNEETLIECAPNYSIMDVEWYE